MVYLNALTAQRMPETTALPDYLHEKFSIAKSLRESKYYGNYQISNIACIINGITLISFFFTARDSFNVRRIVIIYATLCYIRAVSFFLTTMPAPCTGTTKCPCSEHKALTDLKHANPFMIAFSWLFGLGMFLTHPQCGDLVISGHTMFLWLSTLGILDVIRIKIPTPFKQLMSASWVMFIMVSLLFIIISRNHYSIDVWFGFIFPQMFWMLYKAGQNSLKFKPGNNDSCLLELLRWIEYRKFQLIDDEEQNNEENVQIYEEPTM
ncbi:phosphatidylcholine:ceramide cholinephosphotransferase 2-like isoform X6 [Histomonas meleagridis]|uniref:phosphatidylcholine:ceramide cholinephosphotransferase 2-like isoform X6 n=1 Tax=Histomonas meleagridis TaxID=135588 RepID=UPI00355AB3F6|nr:phosphatidylcholine:ceramide cholinephosphotransferase 2-like isoform X6 [Histomonas meleagridis]KAH0799870.1 phosphatidylcholine:ceramide cholinephosphotransferase 2-like isoform X6 [Histomonas meleagridis]